MAWKNKGIACVLLLLLAALVLPQSGGVPPVQAESRALTALNDSIRVDISCGTGPCSGSKISNSNTTRKLVVSSTGVIFALFWNTSGIWVSKSTNRGATFSAPKRVTATSVEGEIAISGDGTLYVSWNDSSTYKISKSTNAGNTWGAPITIGAATSSSATLHTAVDGDYIYAVIQNGTKVYVSSNAGVTCSINHFRRSRCFYFLHRSFGLEKHSSRSSISRKRH